MEYNVTQPLVKYNVAQCENGSFTTSSTVSNSAHKDTAVKEVRFIYRLNLIGYKQQTIVAHRITTKQEITQVMANFFITIGSQDDRFR